jgi:uncharacterized protein involved in outer membrane biogenesis
MQLGAPRRRHILYALVALVGLPFLLCGLALATVSTVGLRPCVERVASWSLDRAVEIGTIRVAWGRHVAIEAGDISVANASWAGASSMLRIGRLSAVVDALSLLRGVVRYDKLRIDDASLVLERAADGRANWKFGDAPDGPGDARAKGGLALVPKNRRQFPTLRDFVLANGHIVYRHAGSRDIDIAIKHGAIASQGDDTPVRLLVVGSYDGTWTSVVGFEMATFDELRDATVPFNAGISLVTDSADLTLHGAFEEPLDFDGSGPLHIDIRSLGDFAKAFSVEQAPRLPLRGAGTFRHKGDSWQLSGLSGSIGNSAFTGALTLEEGARGQSDRLRPDLDFTAVDVAALLEGRAGGGGMALGAPTKAGLTVEGEVRARQAHWGKYRVSQVRLQAAVTNQTAQSLTASFGYAGGEGQATLDLSEGTGSGRITGKARLTGADLANRTLPLTVDPHELSGKIDLALSWQMQGATLAQALPAATGEVALSIRQGAIGRRLLDTASSDLGAIFHEKGRMVPVSCFHAVGDLQSGVLYIQNARLRAGETQLDAKGSIDLVHRHVGIVVYPHSSRTLALDHPLAIRGPLADPSFGPSDGRAVSPPRPARPSPAPMATNPCSR